MSFVTRQVSPHTFSFARSRKAELQTVSHCRMTNMRYEVWQVLKTADGHTPNMATHFTWHDWARKEESEEGSVSQWKEVHLQEVRGQHFTEEAMSDWGWKKEKWACGRRQRENVWVYEWVSDWVKLNDFEWWRQNVRRIKEKVGHCGDST